MHHLQSPAKPGKGESLGIDDTQPRGTTWPPPPSFALDRGGTVVARRRGASSSRGSVHRGASSSPRPGRRWTRGPDGVSSSASASTGAVMGDGWDARLADAFRDCPETRALVTCDLVTLRPCELCPELPMWLLDDGDDVLALWERTEAFAAASSGGGLCPPYWAVPWVGGQGVARYILDNPEVVRGRSVLDVGSGCGVAALAAARAGAARVCANDIDPLAVVAFLANADACGLSNGPCTLETSHEDLLRAPISRTRAYDVVMAGDVCFVKGLAEAFQSWLSAVAEDDGCVVGAGGGRTVLLGDPARQTRWAPTAGWAVGARRAGRGGDRGDFGSDGGSRFSVDDGVAGGSTGGLAAGLGFSGGVRA